MTVPELIEKLKEYENEFGDIPIIFENNGFIFHEVDLCLLSERVCFSIFDIDDDF